MGNTSGKASDKDNYGDGDRGKYDGETGSQTESCTWILEESQLQKGAEDLSWRSREISKRPILGKEINRPITRASEKRRGTSGFRRTLAPLFLLLADHAESRAWKYL